MRKTPFGRLRQEWHRIGDRHGVLRSIGMAMIAIVCGLMLVLAAFPWGLLARSAIRPLSVAVGRPIAVGGARRLDWLSFTPTILLTDVSVAQPGWVGTAAGPEPMARIAEARVTVPIFPLLLGHFRPHALDLRGVRVALFRNATGRSNWQGGSRPDGHYDPPRLGRLTIADARAHLVDLRRGVVLDADIVSDAAHGLAVDGRGTLRRETLAIRLRGGSLATADPLARYPLRLSVRSPLVAIDAAAMLDRPLDTQGFTAHLVTSGRDLRYFDDIVQAGLLPTQAFALSGDVRRDSATWHIRRVAGRVGRSILTAAMTVSRTAGRTHIEGSVTARAFDFADFSSDEQRARGAALDKAAGPHVLPDTRIRLDGLARIDGSMRLDVARLLVSPNSPFRSLHVVATMDHDRLTLAPFEAGLVAGRLTGTIVDDGRGHTPHLALELRIANSTIQALALHSGAVQGPFAMRIRLRGRGDRFRQAIGNASGHVGFSVPQGTIRRDYATFLGGDVVRSMGAAVGGSDGRVPLRCLVGSFVANDGKLTPAPLVLDTAISRGDATGSIDMSSEAIALTFVGRSKDSAMIRSTAPTRVFGTMSDPQIDIRPPRAKEGGKSGTLGRIGFFLKGLRIGRGGTDGRATGATPAPDVDCGALQRAALR